jgi:hypothetical protein
MISMPYATYGAVLDWSSAIEVNKRSYSVEAFGQKSKLTENRKFKYYQSRIYTKYEGHHLHICKMGT